VYTNVGVYVADIPRRQSTVAEGHAPAHVLGMGMVSPCYPRNAPHMCLSKKNDRYVDVHSVHGLSASDAACRPCVHCVHLAVMCRQVRELTVTGQSPNVKRRAHSRLWGGWYGSTRPCGAAARAGQVVPYSSFLGMGVRVIHSVHEPAGWGDL
jgi:hypothetical protein